MKNTEMKKISLKNILKKTFKKKKVKKILKSSVTIKKSKASKIKANKKKINKIVKAKAKAKVKVVKKKIKIKSNEVKIDNQKISKNKEVKIDNLRISKSNEVKPEIKKIKKQETAKKEYKLKDYIVYPKHGVGQILSISSKTIGGIDVQCYDIKFEKDKAIGLLPINKQSHLRPLATINQINKSISILKSKPKIKRSMWSRRAQEYEQKITSGKIYDLAEVVRDLNKGEDLMVDQSYSERQLFEKAYERILAEFQIVMNISLEDTQKKLDKALKRNLESQNIKPDKKTETIASSSEISSSPEITE